MFRPIPVLALALAACSAAPDDTTTSDYALSGPVLDLTREHVAGDVYHYEAVLAVGDTPNAELHVHRVVRERAPWIPRAGGAAAMLLHGDFSTFRTNYLPEGGGMAGYLAARGIDVWGVDRRWASAPADADLSDFGEMGLAQELGDVRTALGFARAVRLLNGRADRLNLVGFSRGGQIAYAYASQEAALPRGKRHVDGLVPLDVYFTVPPDAEATRQFFCESAAYEQQALADGIVDSENSFLITVGQLAIDAPDDESPLFPPFTNRQTMLMLVGQTYQFAPFSPLYHLAAPVLDGDLAVGLRDSPEGVVASWLAGASPHQSMRESAESDALWCGDAPLPIDAPMDRIEIPLYYLGAAGGMGDLGLYTTTLVSSTDVTTEVIRRGVDEAEDFGHADLLFATDAATLAWQPLAAWIEAH
jgi:pimeloyl-ACP methyl ester carboxylesterase